MLFHMVYKITERIARSKLKNTQNFQVHKVRVMFRVIHRITYA